MEKMVYFLMPMIVESVTGVPIKAISFDSINIYW